MAIQTLVSNVGNQPHATGLSNQAHIIYASNAGKWLHFYFTGTNTLQCDYSADFSTWASAGSLTLTNNHNLEGRNLSVAYVNAGGTDAIHIAISYQVSTSDHRAYHVRATFSGTAISFGTETEIGSSSGEAAATQPVDGAVVGVDSNSKIFHPTGFLNEGGGTWASESVARYPNADTAAAWTMGTPTIDLNVTNVTNGVGSYFICSLGSGSMLTISDNGTASTGNGWKNLNWSKWSGSSWSASANVLGSSLSANSDDNNWGAVARSTSDIHLVYKSATSTLTHLRFNGTSWSAGDTIASETIKDASGISLITDGTSVWLFVIDNTNNVIKYTKWVSGTGWSAWTTFESSTANRNNLSVCPQIVSNQIAVIWTDGASSPFAIKGELLTLATTSTHDLSTLFALKAQASQDLSTLFSLAQQQTKDLSTLFALAQQTSTDLSTLFALAQQTSTDLSTLFVLAGTAATNDFSTLFVLTATGTALVLYGLQASASTLPQAAALTNQQGSLTSATINTLLGQATGFGEITGKGTTTAWPSFLALPEPSGLGFLWDVTTLELQQIQAGQWQPELTLSVDHGSVVADLYCRVFLWMAGCFVPVQPVGGGGLLKSGVTLTTTPQTLLWPGGQLLPPISFIKGAKLYLDLWANVLSNSSGNSGTNLQLVVSAAATGESACQVVTPGYVPLPLEQQKKLWTFGGFCLNDGTNYKIPSRPYALPEVTPTIQPIARMDGSKITDVVVQPRKIAVPLEVLGVGRDDVAMKLDALYQALAQRQQKLVLAADGRYVLADALSAPYKFVPGDVQRAQLTVTFQSPVAYATSPIIQQYTSGPVAYPSVGGGSYAQTVILPGNGGNAPSLPTLVVTNSSPPVFVTLTSQLNSGTAYTSLAVTATQNALSAGDTLKIGSSPSQTVTVSANVSAGATSIPVTSFTASNTFAIGATVARVFAITSLTIQQVTNGAALTIAQNLYADQGSGADSWTIICDPFATSGESVFYRNQTTPQAHTGTFKLAVEPTPTTWTITAAAASQPTLTVNWAWAARYLT